MEERWPWEAEESLEPSDPLAHQRLEESFREQLPHVVKLLPVQGTVMGSSSPHQTGDIVCYDILKRGRSMISRRIFLIFTPTRRSAERTAISARRPCFA